MRLLSRLTLPTLLSLLALAAAPALALALAQERVFDIVPPAGKEVQMVDGYTVLRLPGTKFGAVLTYMPESETTAWIPVAVLNTSGARLKVGTKGVSAHHGGTALKVWSTSGLVRLAKEGSISAPKALVEATAKPGNSPLAQTQAPIAPTVPDTIGPGQTGQPSPKSQAQAKASASRNNAQQRQHELAVAQVSALRDRLFRDKTIDASEVGRGDVRIDLPPRRSGSQPAEFVLTLSFGGETMDVTYRERVAP